MPRKQGVVNRDTNATNRALDAVRMRTEGKTYQTIADAVGYASAGSCHDAIMRELARNSAKEVNSYRAEQVAILDRLLEAVIPMALGDPQAKTVKERRPSLFAVDRVVAILERKARLLGLDVKTDAAPMPTVIIREYPAEALANL